MAGLMGAVEKRKSGGIRRAADAGHDPADLTPSSTAAGGAPDRLDPRGHDGHDVAPGEPARPDPADVDAPSLPSAKLIHFDHRPDNPRWEREYDPAQDPELERFGDTVDGFGILQAVTVTSLGAYLEHHPEHRERFGPEVRFVVMMGNRRLAIARHKGLPSLPYLVNDKLAARGMVRMAGWIENYQRKQLDPIREAGEFAAELAETRESVRSLAKRIGISHAQINQRLQLLNLIPELQAVVSDGDLTVQKALLLAKLPPAEQQQVLEAGPPYQPSKPLPDAELDGGAGKSLSTPRAVTIRQRSTPEQVVETLRAKLPLEILHAVMDLLQSEPDASQPTAPSR